MKRKILSNVNLFSIFLILCIGIMFLPTEVFAVGEVTVSGTKIYANGNAIILDEGTMTVYTVVYLDSNCNGAIDGGEPIQTIEGATGNADVSGYDLGGYYIYGGSNTVNLADDTKITMLGGKVQRIYGGGDRYSVNNTDVTIESGQVSNIAGGSDVSDVNGSTNITISGGTFTQSIFASSAAAKVTGNTYVTISGGTFSGPIYGGGTNWTGNSVNGSTYVTISGGTFVDPIYGGSIIGNIGGSTNVTISGGTFTNTIYGGSSNGDIGGSTNVTISGGTLTGVQGDSVSGSISGAKNIRVSGGSIGSITSGTLTNNDDPTSNVYKTTLTLPGISAVTDVSDGSLSLDEAASGYGLHDVKTTGAGLLTFYLPIGDATASYNSVNYTAAVAEANDPNNAFADTTAPTLSATSLSSVTATSAGINFTSDEAGSYYYLVYEAADAEPSAATVKAQGVAVKKGTAAALAAANSVSISGLTASTAYKAYVIIEDVVGNPSGVSAIAFTTASAPVQATPTFSPGAGAIAYGSTVTISSAGADAIYYTTDGTDPTTASTNQATTQLVINAAVTAKAIAVKAGMPNSAIGSAAYTQAASANLTGLVLSGTPGNYTFAGGTYVYNGVTVANGVASITVTPTGAGTITVDGTPVATTVASASIALTAGVEKTITAVATETGKTAKTYTIKVTRAAPPTTYTMTAIADQTLTPVKAGYGAGTQETKALTITRTGTGDLASLATALSGANAGSFTITQPAETTLNDGIPNTTFNVKANHGLAVGTYTVTVTVSATNMTNETFTVTQVINAASGGRESGRGGSGGGSTPSPTPTPAAQILNDITTQDEQKLESSLQQTGEAKIDLASTGTGQANITGNVLEQLSQLDKPLNIAGQGVSLQFATDSLQTSQIIGQNNNATVQIGAAPVTNQEQEAILAATPLGESTGVFQVGGQVFNLTAQLSTTSSSGSTSSEKIISFAEPVAVTIDLSGLSLTPEQIGQLTGTRLEKNEQGEIVPVFLGGTYDPVNKTFTFYTDKFSIYTVLQKNGIVILNLTIGNTITKLNGAVKTIDVPPTLINNSTFVPLRFIGEALGANFDWNGETRTVTFQSGEKKIALTEGKAIAGMTTPPINVNGRILVPLRYISEAFGAQVMWFPASRSVSVVK